MLMLSLRASSGLLDRTQASRDTPACAVKQLVDQNYIERLTTQQQKEELKL
jgi:hypothetical protein